MSRLPDEIAAFVRGGLSVLVASRDAGLQPWLSRGVAATVGEDRASLTVYVPDRAGESLLAVVAPGAPLAVTLSEVPTHRSVQLKGIVTAVRPARDEERLSMEAQVGGFNQDLGVAGLPLPVLRRFVTWPATAIEMRIEASFVQTPGPGAGRPTESA